MAPSKSRRLNPLETSSSTRRNVGTYTVIRRAEFCTLGASNEATSLGGGNVARAFLYIPTLHVPAAFIKYSVMRDGRSSQAAFHTDNKLTCTCVSSALKHLSRGTRCVTCATAAAFDVTYADHGYIDGVQLVPFTTTETHFRIIRCHRSKHGRVGSFTLEPITVPIMCYRIVTS